MIKRKMLRQNDSHNDIEKGRSIAEKGRQIFITLVSSILSIATLVMLFLQGGSIILKDLSTDPDDAPIKNPENNTMIIAEPQDMHAIVSKYNKLFQNNIEVNWEPFEIDEKKRCKLQDVSSEIGISISSYDEIDSWAALKDDGINYALIRIGGRGYGSGEVYSDSKFNDYMDSAIEHEIKVGCYFVSQAVNQTEADEEVEKIVNAIKEYKGSLEYPIGISLERQERTADLSDMECVEIVKYICIRLLQSGYTPMIMGGETWFLQFADGTFDGYLKLVSTKQKAPNSIDNCIVWEYEDSAYGVVDSISSPLELSVSIYGLLE